MHKTVEYYTTQNLLRISFLTLHISVLSLTIHLYENLIIVYFSYRFVMYSLHYLYLIPLNQFSYLLQIHKSNTL